MKNKKVLVVIFILFIAAVVIIYLNQTKMKRWQEAAADYLKICYTADFVLINSEEKDSDYIFTYVTDDENQIEFQVFCWWGNVYTPWGDIPFTIDRHMRDDFEENICEFSVSKEKCYDVTGKDMDEIIQIVKSNYEIAKNYYNTYGISYRKPKVYINFKRGEHYATIAYGGAEAFLRGIIRDELY